MSELLETGPFHDALRAAIKASGLTLHSVQQRMAARGSVVSTATLSFWQSGQRRPQRRTLLQTVADLEQVLRLSSGSLSALLAPEVPGAAADRVPRRRPGRSWEEMDENAAAIRRLLDTFGPGVQDRLLVVSQHEFAEMGEHRELQRCDNMVVVEARAVVDRYLLTYGADPGCDIDNIRVYARENCRVGRVKTDPDARLIVAELLFDRLLYPGETHAFSFGHAHRNTTEHREVQRTLRSGADIYVLHVKFNRQALPVRCYRYHTNSLFRPEEYSELFLGPHQAVHTVERAASPGLYGITWTWP